MVLSILIINQGAETILYNDMAYLIFRSDRHLMMIKKSRLIIA